MSLAKHLAATGFKPSDAPHTPFINPKQHIKHSVNDYLQAIDKAAKTGVTKPAPQDVKVETFLI